MIGIKGFLGYNYYNIGYGLDGKITQAESVSKSEVMMTVDYLNADYNVYLRLNANYYSKSPQSIADRHIKKPTVYVIDVDEKDNPGVDIEAKLQEFILSEGMDNYLFQATGHGYQLWIRSRYVLYDVDFKRNARNLVNNIEMATGLKIDFTPNPSRYGRFPGTINHNKPRTVSRIIHVMKGKPYRIRRRRPGEVGARWGGGGIHKPVDPGTTVASVREDPTTPHAPRIPNPFSPLAFIRKNSYREEVADILHLRNPKHNRRLWLVGILNHCGASKSQILDIISKMNHWKDYSPEETEKQVTSVLKKR